MSDAQQKLLKKLNEISDIKQDAYLDIFYYIIVVGIMSFFVYIILSDLYKILKLHSIQSNDSKKMFESKSKAKILNDDNEYEIDFNEGMNKNKELLDGLTKANMAVYNKFNNLIQFKAENHLDNLEIDVNENNINSKNDDWNYPVKRKDSSFWSMIFEKPKHYSLVNNSDSAFISAV
jgi:hypothetical protein